MAKTLGVIVLTAHEDCERISEFLWHGYAPPRVIPDWISRIPSTSLNSNSYTPEQAISLLNSNFERLVKSAESPFVVPISGGWDSRIILGILSEHEYPILSVSFGCRGQLDFELGRAVAEFLGVRHMEVCLDEIELEWSDLKNAAVRSPWTYMPEAFFSRIAYEKSILAGGRSLWIGFLGDPLTGGHDDPSHFSENLTEARSFFASTQRRVPRDWFPADPKPDRWYPSIEGLGPSFISYRQILDFGIRQRGCVAPAVLGVPWRGWEPGQGEFKTGVSVITPFTDPDWAAYWVNAPVWARKDQTLYKEMAFRRFASLFSLPSKYSWGVRPNRRISQKVVRLHHGLRNRLYGKFPRLPMRSGITDNYMDFQTAFRKREDYATVMEEAISVLKERETTPWLDLDCIWNEHYCGKKDNAQALQVLLGLAVNIDAGN